MRSIFPFVWAAPTTALGLLAVLAGVWRVRLRVVDGVLEAYGPALAWLLRHATPISGGVAAAWLRAKPRGRGRRFPSGCGRHRLVVSGGHNAGFDAMCDDLAERIGGSRMVVAGAGHEIQFAGRPLNEALLAVWRTGSPCV